MSASGVSPAVARAELVGAMARFKDGDANCVTYDRDHGRLVAAARAFVAAVDRAAIDEPVADPAPATDIPALVEPFAIAYMGLVAAGYRPAAPSDGLGNVTAPSNVSEEAARYRAEFIRCEDEGFFIGTTDYDMLVPTIYAIEAARLLCGGSGGQRIAADLLQRAYYAIEYETHAHQLAAMLATAIREADLPPQVADDLAQLAAMLATAIREADLPPQVADDLAHRATRDDTQEQRA